jgi:hypothetical protein
MKIRLTEKQLEDLIKKTLSEQPVSSSTLTPSQAGELPSCEKMKEEQLVNSLVTKTSSSNSRMSQISTSFNKRIGTDKTASLYLVKNKQPLCKLR